MASVEERLAAAGIRLRDGAEVEIRPEVAGIAARVHQRGCRSLGLLPARDDVGVPSLALQLGLALAAVAGRPAGVVDAAGTWLAPASGAAGGDEVFLPSTEWLTDRLALVVPGTTSIGSTVRGLEACVRERALAMEHLVVDLTGLDHAGEHLEAFSLLDAVAIVARAGRITARQLGRWMQEIPAEKNVGVILLGG